MNANTIQRQLGETKKEAASIAAEYRALSEVMDHLRSTLGTTAKRIWDVEFNRFSRGVDRVDVRFRAVKAKLERIRKSMEEQSADNAALATELDSQVFALLDGAHGLMAKIITDKDKEK